MADGIFQKLRWLIGLIVAIWVIQLINAATGYALNRNFGLDPRDVTGLIGIPAMPFLHGSMAHALSNTLPLAILGSLFALVTRENVMGVNFIIVFLGGVLVWIFARDAIHVGASGLLFGWFGFLLVRGIVDRSLIATGVAIVVAVTYGTMIWGVLPRDPSVSWEAHLLGAVAGVAAAVLVPTHVENPRRLR